MVHRLIVLTFLLSTTAAIAGELQSIALPAPRTTGGRPFMEVLKDRKTTREFRRDPIAAQTLSDLLWAAFGINRAQSSHRTAPSAMNSQEIEIYVTSEAGLFLYDARAHRLNAISAQDLRSRTGGQPFIADAPIALIFVADFARAEKMKDAKEFYTAIDTGYISQNVYLYCASAGLGTVVHDLPNRAELVRAMKLRDQQKIILAQAVGWPATPAAD